MATPPPAGTRRLKDLTDEERDLIRQGERTVDNLKRLFAFVFSLSFASIGAAAATKLLPILTGSPPPPVGAWVLNAEMLLVFVVTAGVFFHQSAKFLDNRYARHPLSEANWLGFAMDYFTQVGTAAPFFFMAYAFSPLVTQKIGYIGFFGFYVLLLSFGLLLLLLQTLRHSKRIRAFMAEVLAEEELAREGVLRTYWLVMNSFMLLVILIIFQAFVWSGISCPTSPSANERLPAFLFIFGLLAMVRDFLDYRWAWPFLYPIKPDTAAKLVNIWPLTSIGNARQRGRWIVVGCVFVACSFGLLTGTLKFWDFTHWATVCKIIHSLPA